MLTQIIFWIGVFLVFLLLLRGIQAKWLSRFPLFYAYILSVFLETVPLFVVFERAPQYYARAYWVCQCIALVMGSLVVFEIYRRALQAYPGTARVARNLLLVVFSLALAKVLVNYSYGSPWWPAATYQELERNLRIVQAFAVLALIVAIVAYAIPRDRHLKGILAGYGLFVAASIVQLSLLSHLGSSLPNLLAYIQPFSFDVVLLIWTVTLWSPLKGPFDRPPSVPPDFPDANHPVLVERSQRALQEIRLGLPGGVRR